MHVSLTPQLAQMVKQKVKSGLYNNASEVLREALRIMWQRDVLYKTKIELLRKEVAVGAVQAERGEFVSQTISEIIDEAKREKYGKV